MHQLLIKYLENRCTAYELNNVLAYLRTEKGRQHLAELMDHDIHEHYGDSFRLDEIPIDDQVFEGIKSRIAEESHNPRVKRVSFSRKWYALAATVSGIMLVAAFSFFYIQQPTYILHKTAFGETKTISLPDGSSVTLNANSSLRLLDDFNKERQVWLKGEAYFEVEEVARKHKPGFIKFTVHTDRLDVEVLGTAFNVQDWQRKTQVVLASGKVRLRSADKQEMTMKPGELAEISEEATKIKKKEVNPVVYTSWKENKLYCDDTPLSEIADLIKYRYEKDVSFRQASLRKITISGTLPLDDLALLTKVLQESLKINIQAYETEIVISTNKKTAQRSNRLKGIEQVNSTPLKQN